MMSGVVPDMSPSSGDQAPSSRLGMSSAKRVMDPVDADIVWVKNAKTNQLSISRRIDEVC